MPTSRAIRPAPAGYALILVTFVLFGLGIIGFTFMSMAGSETRASQQSLDTQRAFWLAESGRNRALGWMTSQAVPPVRNMNIFAGAPGPDGGVYTVDCAVDSATLAQGEIAYYLDCVGESRGIRRRIVQRIRQISFARFAYFTDDERTLAGGPVWHATGETVGGPMHSNGTIRIAGSPHFQGLVTSAAGQMIAYPSFVITDPGQFPIGGNAPTFDQGVRLRVHAIVLPASITDLEQASQTGGVYFPTECDLELGVIGNGAGTPAPGWFRYRKHPYTVPDWAWVRISTLANTVFCCGDVLHVQGVLDGTLTVAAERDIRIENDLLYAGSSSQGVPLPGCDDMLGLVAGRNVVFVDNLANHTNLVVDGVMMALDNVIQTENYSTGTSRGTLTVWGGLIQKYQGPIGTTSTGYRTNYHYDARVTDRLPAPFPLTGVYQELTWAERRDDAGTF
jgi:hypothetical protein